MATEKYADYKNEALKPFTERLLNDYYKATDVLCNNARSQAERVNTLESGTFTSEYAMLCCGVIDDIKQHIKLRKEQFIPYIHELVEKASASHDCSSCTGNCHLNHEIQLMELSVSNEEAKKILRRLQLAGLPLYSQTMFPDEYRVLRNRMALLEMNTTELFFLEYTYLIPKIVESQKMINASYSA